MMDATRSAALLKLVWLREPVAEMLTVLNAFAWDSPDAIAFDEGPILAVLHRFVAGDLSADEVQAWAEALESREDVDFDADRSGRLDDLIFRLANPELAGAITVARAKQLIAEASRGG